MQRKDSSARCLLSPIRELMMSYRLPCPVQKEFAGRTVSYRSIFHRVYFQCVGLITILSWLLFFNACAGSSTPSSSSVNPATNPTASLIISATLPAATVGSTYSGSVTVTGGTAPYIFSTASGQLPAGVQLGESTGTISGTPTTSGSFNFAISVSDSKGLSKHQSLQITVSNAATANPPAAPPTGQNGGNSISNLQHSG